MENFNLNLVLQQAQGAWVTTIILSLMIVGMIVKIWKNVKETQKQKSLEEIDALFAKRFDEFEARLLASRARCLEKERK